MEYPIDLLNALVMLTNFVFIPALTYGSQLALGALGITLIFGILRFANFAHGDLMALGTAVVILVTWGLQAAGLSFGPLPTALLALPFGILAAMGTALLTDISVYKFYREKKSPPVVFLIASIGVMFMMNGLVRLLIGPADRNFADGERFLIKARSFKDMTGLAEGISFKTSQGLTILIAFLSVMALFWFLQKTRTGKAMRAFSDNEDLALLSGVDPNQVVRITWIITAVLATLAGTLYGLDKSFKPFVYFHLLLPMFAAAIVGGLGQPKGAILGGFLIAFSEMAFTYAYKRFFTYVLPEAWVPEGLSQFLATDYKFAVSFVILVLVLLIRPTGIYKGTVT